MCAAESLAEPRRHRPLKSHAVIRRRTHKQSCDLLASSDDPDPIHADLGGVSSHGWIPVLLWAATAFFCELGPASIATGVSKHAVIMPR